MHVQDSKTVEIVELTLPGDWRQRVKMGPERDPSMDVPVHVRKGKKKTYDVVCGWSTLLRAAAAGMTSVEVHVVKASDDEAEAFADMEKQGHTDMLRQLLASVVRKKRKEYTSRKPVDPDVLAVTLGLTAEQLRDAEADARERQAAKMAPLYSYGIPLTKSWLSYTDTVRGTLADVRVLANRIIKALESLDPFAIRRVREHVKAPMVELYGIISGLQPQQVCPFCKCLEPYRDQCAACEREGWVGELAPGYQIPPELLSDAPLYVVSNGQLVEIDKALLLEEFGEDVPEDASAVDVPEEDAAPTGLVEIDPDEPQPDPPAEPTELELEDWAKAF